MFEADVLHFASHKKPDDKKEIELKRSHDYVHLERCWLGPW